jgi:hypothetical protein
MQVPDAERMKNGEGRNSVHSKHFYDTLPFFAHSLQKIATVVILNCRVETGRRETVKFEGIEEDPEFQTGRTN